MPDSTDVVWRWHGRFDFGFPKQLQRIFQISLPFGRMRPPFTHAPFDTTSLLPKLDGFPHLERISIMFKVVSLIPLLTMACPIEAPLIVQAEATKVRKALAEFCHVFIFFIAF